MVLELADLKVRSLFPFHTCGPCLLLSSRASSFAATLPLRGLHTAPVPSASLVTQLALCRLALVCPAFSWLRRPGSFPPSKTVLC